MSDFLRTILDAINGVVSNYGWSIVIFTMLIRLVLMPLDYRSRKSMRKMSTVQGEMNRLQKKYANDKQKLNQKMTELYKKEGVSPLSGCIPMLIQWPVLFAMFAAMRAIANEQMVAQVFRFLAGAETPIVAGESWLWIKNVWASDSIFTSIAPSIESLRMIGADVWQKVYSNLGSYLTADQVTALTASLPQLDFSSEAFKTTLTEVLTMLQGKDTYIATIQAISPAWKNVSVLLFSFTVYKNWNGLLILPALAALTQIFMTKMNPAANGQTQPPAQQGNDANPAASTGKFMQVFFPLLSVYFCLTSNASFAIYWVTSNIVMGIMSYGITRYLESHDKPKPPTTV
ncbi:MAG: YidC/Oxa1 family membrane protein insertase [Clostridia bacterium]|nr:YidC/Oxa1 family membrane protein insertase [Clostridia bacterium]